MKKLAMRVIPILIVLSLLPQGVLAAQLLVPGGQVIGGLQVGDRIVSIDGKTVRTVEDVREVLDASDGRVDAGILRSGKTKRLRLQPEITPDGPKLGVYLKQGVTGVGTVTWYDPDTGRFGALGHGVNDAQGELLTMRSGSVYDADILSVKTGKAGNPGQLLGALDSRKCLGILEKNTPQGVFGTCSVPCGGEPLPVGSHDQIHTGQATIVSTVRGSTPKEYSVEILKIYANTKGSLRNMLLRVTDPALLEATGGIVQGMSGSPIIQDGKLVGAVTHVLVNDPTTGYGIFIENMLDAAA